MMPDKPTYSEATQQAITWFVRLSSGVASQHEYQDWQRWRDADPNNEAAWKKVEHVSSQFKGLSAEPAVKGTLKQLYDKPHSESRRQLLKHLVVVMSVGAIGYASYQRAPWQGVLADYATQTGESRLEILSDGTRLTMNTDSVVDIHFDATQRLISLVKGEVLIETGHEAERRYRPFIVHTQHGVLTALGTRFSVRDYQTHAHLSVYEGAVKVEPQALQSEHLILQAGESVSFSQSKLHQKGQADVAEVAWADGFVIADNTTLSQLLNEFSRYRPGLLQCDPSIASLNISGSFPTNTDAALDILVRKLPIKRQSFTKYWVRLVAA